MIRLVLGRHRGDEREAELDVDAVRGLERRAEEGGVGRRVDVDLTVDLAGGRTAQAPLEDVVDAGRGEDLRGGVGAEDPARRAEGLSAHMGLQAGEVTVAILCIAMTGTLRYTWIVFTVDCALHIRRAARPQEPPTGALVGLEPEPSAPQVGREGVDRVAEPGARAVEHHPDRHARRQPRHAGAGADPDGERAPGRHDLAHCGALSGPHRDRGLCHEGVAAVRVSLPGEDGQVERADLRGAGQEPRVSLERRGLARRERPGGDPRELGRTQLGRWDLPQRG